MSHVPNKTNRSQATPPFLPDAKTISPLAPSGQQLPQVPPDPRLTPTHQPFLRDTRVLPRGTASAQPRPPGRHIRQSGAAPHPPAPILSSRLVSTSNSWSTWASMRTKEANFCFETFARRYGYIHQGQLWRTPGSKTLRKRRLLPRPPRAFATRPRHSSCRKSRQGGPPCKCLSGMVDGEYHF